MSKIANIKVGGVPLCETAPGPSAKLAKFARKAAAEGAVLLKNENNTLPFKKGEVISVFGRTQKHYIKSGTGSGGCVNVDYVIDIPTGLRNSGVVKLNEDLVKIYDKWIEENPYSDGHGWNLIPWAQEEMPLTDKIVADAASVSSAALIVLGRNAGESRDNHAGQGSYLLFKKEAAMIKRVCEHFDRVCVVLNAGNVIDMSWVEKYGVEAVMYVWQGGQEGGNAVADLLTGKVNPSGKLVNTIASKLSDHYSDKNFGDKNMNIYAEDIYVGYRYFETFAKDKVVYPFGFGLSYTTFEKKLVSASSAKKSITLSLEVKNTGSVSGKEVVQVYVEAPQGKLGKPLRVLAAYAKTKLLAPGQSQILKITFSTYRFASYDDSGVTGNKSCYVLEKGDYGIYVGGDVRSAELVYTYNVGRIRVVDRCSEVCAPVTPFKRLVAKRRRGGGVRPALEDAPLRTVSMLEKIEQDKAELGDFAYTGDKGLKLVDVYEGRATLEAFTAQLDNRLLASLVKGEGMCSPLVTPGTGGAIGGLNDFVREYGIPPVCVTDGPSGIRMDGGGIATSLPSGTLLACSWNPEMVEKLYNLLTAELYTYNIDCLLGCGMNIHRHPLNGRNFEYFSEDPLIAGTMAVANCRGILKGGNTITIKHFLANSQEDNRTNNDSVLSERALREIYAKGFEIAVRDGSVRAIMTSYNMVNGIHAASNFDTTTQLVRNEWGYDHLIMTDWWAFMNEENALEPRTKQRLAEMIRAQNDIYMVQTDSFNECGNILPSIESGYLSRAQLARCAMRVLKFILASPSFEKFVDGGCKFDNEVPDNFEQIEPVLVINEVKPHQEFAVPVLEGSRRCGRYVVTVEVSSDANEVEQIPLSVLTVIDKAWSGACAAVFSFTGTGKRTVTASRAFKIVTDAHKLSFTYDEKLLNIKSIKVRRLGDL
jgi:beta-glucosidase